MRFSRRLGPGRQAGGSGAREAVVAAVVIGGLAVMLIAAGVVEAQKGTPAGNADPRLYRCAVTSRFFRQERKGNCEAYATSGGRI